MKTLSLIVLLLTLSISAFGANMRLVQLGPEVTVDINGAGQNMTFVLANNDPAHAAAIFLYNAVPQLDAQGVLHPVGDLVVWTFTQQPGTTSPATPVPTVDNFGQPITWTIGQIATKGGGSVTGLVSPSYSLTMIGE